MAGFFLNFFMSCAVVLTRWHRTPSVTPRFLEGCA